MTPVAATCLRTLCLAAALVLASGLQGPARAADGGATIVVTGNGWHTGIAIARADLPPGAIPEVADFPDAAWIEFGWGDAEYYPDPDPGMLLALKSTVPGPAVVHVSGLWGHPAQVFPETDWVPVAVTGEGMANLIVFLNAGFDRGGAKRVQASDPGLHSFSLFYPATGRFHLLNTCNTWVARGLAVAGLPVDPDGVVRASQLMDQVRPLARRPAAPGIRVEPIALPRPLAPGAAPN